MKWTSVIFGLVTCATAVVQGQKLTYEDHVLPILENSCTNCHNPDKKKGDLDLTTYRGLMAGSSGGQIVTAGDGGGSKMFTTAAHTAEPFMPPKGERLGKKEIDLIRAWIDGGLLETKDSKAKKSNTPKIDFSGIDTNKPSGPPPIPAALSTDPVVVPARAGFVADIESSPWAPVLAITSQKQVLLYNTDNADLIGVLPFPEKKGNPESLSFHPSGKYLLAGGGIQGKSGTTVTWDILTGKLIMQTGREYDSVIASSLRSDLQAVATSGPSRLIKMWLTADNSLENNIKKHTDWVTSVSYSHDGVLLATADRNGGLYIWEAETGNPFHNLRGHQKQIVSLKWSPDSNYLASASEDGKVRIWDMNSGKEIKKIDAHNAGVLDMDWSKNGQLITVGRDWRIKLWKADYNLLKELVYKGPMPTKIEWSHDGARFVTADYGGKITIWDSKTYQQTNWFMANPHPLKARLAFVQKALTEKQKIALGKKTIFNQKTQQKNAHQKKINDANAAHKHSANVVNQSNNQIKQHQQKINQLNGQQKGEQNKINQLNGKRGALANKIKQTQAKIAGLDKQIQASNQQVAKFNKEIQQLNQQIQQTKELMAKDAGNKAHQQRLIEINNKLAKAQLELKKHQSVIADLNKKKQAEQQAHEKIHKEQLAANKTADALRKQIDGLNQQKKTLHEAIKKKQQEVAHHRKLVDQKKREAQALQKQLPAMVEQEKKARLELEAFQKTLVPLEQKLERLEKRK